MNEKVIGTLSQFVEIDTPFLPPSQLLRKLPFHKNSISCQKRARTSIDEYVATKKKLEKRSSQADSRIQQNSEQLPQQKSYQRTRFQKQVEKRQRNNIHNISIFKKDAYMAPLHIKTRPKLEQSMLRALEKIRYKDEEQHVTKNKHEVSFDHRPQFSGVKLAPFLFQRKKKTPQYLYADLTLRRSRQNKTSSYISPEKRIQYEQCINWAKKHNKDSSHYQIELGKLKTEQTLDQKSQRRRKLLKKIKTKTHQSRLIRHASSCR